MLSVRKRLLQEIQPEVYVKLTPVSCSAEQKLRISVAADHINAHFDIRPYPCSKCWSHFGRPYDATRHETTCTKQIADLASCPSVQ